MDITLSSSSTVLPSWMVNENQRTIYLYTFGRECVIIVKKYEKMMFFLLIE